MKKIWMDIKWLFNYMTSILMYAVIVILVLVGVLLVAYYVDSRRQAKAAQVPLYGAYVIVSGSMEPIIKVKDAVLIKRVDNADDIKVGDVVTYRSLDESYYGILITHRVVNIQEENGNKIYVTKGDHNETVDRSSIDFSQIYGKVVMRIPKIGYIKYFLVSSFGWIIAIVVPSLGIIIYDILKIVKTVKNKEKKVAVSKGWYNLKGKNVLKIGFVGIMSFLVITTLFWVTYFDRYEGEVLAKNVRLELINNGNINYYNAIPEDDKNSIPTYYFRVRNNVDVPLSYDILIHDVSAQDANDGCKESELFKRNELNYELLLDNKVVKSGILSEINDDILTTDAMEGSKVNDYALRVWLNSNAQKTLGRHYHYIIDIREKAWKPLLMSI